MNTPIYYPDPTDYIRLLKGHCLGFCILDSEYDRIEQRAVYTTGCLIATEGNRLISVPIKDVRFPETLGHFLDPGPKWDESELSLHPDLEEQLVQSPSKKRKKK